MSELINSCTYQKLLEGAYDTTIDYLVLTANIGMLERVKAHVFDIWQH